MESDADRLEAIRAVGGILIYSTDRPQFWAIFDRQYSSVSLGDIDMESRTPALACRSSDLEDLTKDQVLTVDGDDYRVLRGEPDTPAPGWTTVILRA